MKAQFCGPAVAAFELLFRPWMRSRLHEIRVAGLPRQLPANRPLLLVSNHISWWDGFVLREVQRAIRPLAPFHTVMSEPELRRFPFFRRMGVVGMERGSAPSIARAVRVLEARVRERPDAVVVYFPQGRIWPSHRRPLGFGRGVELFARRLDPVVLPIGLHLEPLTHVSPTQFVSVAEPLRSDATARDLEMSVEEQLNAIHRHLAEYGEEAPRRWPGPYGRLPVEPRAVGGRA